MVSDAWSTLDTLVGIACAMTWWYLVARALAWALEEEL